MSVETPDHLGSPSPEVGTEPPARDDETRDRHHGETSRAQGALPRLARWGAIAFCTFHITAELIASMADPIRVHLYPLIAWYGDGLRMLDRWGMFAKPPTHQELTVSALHRGRTRHNPPEKTELSTNYAGTRSGLARIRDARLRKIQTRFRELAYRKVYGKSYLAYWCRYAKARHPDVVAVELTRYTPAKRDDDDSVVPEKPRQRVLYERCEPHAKQARANERGTKKARAKKKSKRRRSDARRRRRARDASRATSRGQP